MAALSILNRPYPCYVLFIGAKLQLRVVCWFTYVFDTEIMDMFGALVPLTQAHGVSSVGVRSGGHGGSSCQRVRCREVEGLTRSF